MARCWLVGDSGNQSDIRKRWRSVCVTPLWTRGLPAVVYYAALATICFNDHLLWFSGLVEMAILAIGERKMRWVR